MKTKPPRLAGDEQYHTTTEAAWICRTAPRTIAKWVDGGLLKGYRLPQTKVDGNGGDRRISRTSLREFLVANGMPTDRLEVKAVPLTSVLLVGIDTTDAFNLSELLGDGYRLSVAANIYDAGRLAATVSPDVAVVDTSIGRLEARLVIGAAQATVSDSMRIVVVCGYDEREAMEAPGRTVLIRPVDTETIAGAIRERAQQ